MPVGRIGFRGFIGCDSFGVVLSCTDFLRRLTARLVAVASFMGLSKRFRVRCFGERMWAVVCMWSAKACVWALSL